MATTDDATRHRIRLGKLIAKLEELFSWRSALHRITFAASAQLGREDVAQRLLFTIPAGHEGHLLVVHGETGSNAGTSAVLDIGRLGQPALFVAGHNVLGAAGVGQRAPAARRLGQTAGQAVDVFGRYV